MQLSLNMESSISSPMDERPTITHRYKRHPHVVVTELDGEVSLFQSDTCDYLALNETGSAIWQVLNTQPTMNEICLAMCQHYEIDLETCQREVEAWLLDALSKRLITSSQCSKE